MAGLDLYILIQSRVVITNNSVEQKLIHTYNVEKINVILTSSTKSLIILDIFCYFNLWS
jgi:hypothetical protein